MAAKTQVIDVIKEDLWKNNPVTVHGEFVQPSRSRIFS